MRIRVAVTVETPIPAAGERGGVAQSLRLCASPSRAPTILWFRAKAGWGVGPRARGSVKVMPWPLPPSPPQTLRDCLAESRQTSWVHSLAPHPLKHAPLRRGPSLFNTAPSTAAWLPGLLPSAPTQPCPRGPPDLTISQKHDDILSHVGVELLKSEGVFQGLLSLVSPILGVFLFLCRDREAELSGRGGGQLPVPRHFGYPNFSCLRAGLPGLGGGSRGCLSLPANVWSVDRGQSKAQRHQPACPGPRSSGCTVQNPRCFFPPSRETFCSGSK